MSPPLSAGAPSSDGIPADVNAIVGGFLSDLGFVQTSRQKSYGYKRAAAAILGLDHPLPDVITGDGALPRIAGIGPASSRVILEVLSSGESPTVESAIEAAGRQVDIERRRRLRTRFLSRAEVRRVLDDASLDGPGLDDYHGDFQLHSEWSDGRPTLAEIVAACVARGYHYAAVTDHSHGLAIAGGMSMADAAAQRTVVDALNAEYEGRFRLLQGIEANIDRHGGLDVSEPEAASFDLVLAAPHSALRKDDDQTARMVAAVSQPHVRILAHPRGRMSGVRAGVRADWAEVFGAAASRGVAIEIDGDPSRQDLDFVLAQQACEAGCLLALDSDAHTTAQLAYSDTALAHARLAGIPVDRIVNCWPLDRLLAWIVEPRTERV